MTFILFVAGTIAAAADHAYWLAGVLAISAAFQAVVVMR